MKKLIFAVWLWAYAALAFAGLTVPTYNGLPFLQVHSASNTGISASTNTKMSLDTVDTDSAGWYSTTNKRYTPLLAGRYRVTAQVNLVAAATANAAYEVMVFKNGSQAAYTLFPSSSGSVNTVVNVTVTLTMNGTTDYIEGWAYCNATSPTVGGGTIATGASYMEITYLGP